MPNCLDLCHTITLCNSTLFPPPLSISLPYVLTPLNPQFTLYCGEEGIIGETIEPATNTDKSAGDEAIIPNQMFSLNRPTGPIQS